MTDACPECGCTKFYVTTYCNYAHCRRCGEAMNPEHSECWVPPQAIKYERHDNNERAIEVLRETFRR